MRIATLSLLTIVLCLCASAVQCQEDDAYDATGSGSNFWGRMKKAVKEFMDRMKSLFNEMKEEIKSRTADMRDWSKDMMESFKKTMFDWVGKTDASQKEKEQMTSFIEKLQMPKENERN